jgi:hypothetical protein
VKVSILVRSNFNLFTSKAISNNGLHHGNILLIDDGRKQVTLVTLPQMLLDCLNKITIFNYGIDISRN